MRTVESETFRMARAAEAMRRPEVREKIRASLMGHPVSAETRAKLAARKLPPLSEDARQKLSLAGRGRKQTPEHIQRAADARRGAKRTEEQRARMSQARISKFPNKRNTREDWDYYHWKRDVHKRDEDMCTICGDGPLVGRNRTADHLLSWKHFPEFRYFVFLGRTLCKSCHDKRTGRQFTNRAIRRGAAA